MLFREKRFKSEEEKKVEKEISTVRERWRERKYRMNFRNVNKFWWKK